MGSGGCRENCLKGGRRRLRSGKGVFRSARPPSIPGQQTVQLRRKDQKGKI